MSHLPDCGLYRTRAALGEQIPAGRLVYFHNHGDPGPGVYLPEAWALNRARFGERGVTIQPEWAASLEPLPAEGFYRVLEPFHCCAKRCRLFEAELLVQLGYDGEARPILFVPEWTERGLAIPERGSLIDIDGLAKIAPLKLAQAAHPATAH
ncbi:MAG TPA: hypothetical protein VGQ83_34880 [Polyangia bacterium]|jgi:hypothetical protein